MPHSLNAEALRIAADAIERAPNRTPAEQSIADDLRTLAALGYSETGELIHYRAICAAAEDDSLSAADLCAVVYEHTTKRNHRVARAVEPARRFDVIRGRRWLKVAERLSEAVGDRTIRWFMDTHSGRWYVAQSWQAPNLSRPLDDERAAYVERIVFGEKRDTIAGRR